MDAQLLSIGIIGVGGIARSVHLPALREMKQLRIAAVCDVIPERAESASKEYEIPGVYENYRAMLAREKLDGVFVLVQPEQSYRIALDCMRAGCDVFVEKPAGITTFQTRSLLRAAQETGRIAQVGMNRRYIPLMQEVVSRMKELTTLTQIEGCFVKHGDASFYDGCASAYYCDTIHAIDILRWLSGADAVSAATVASAVNSPVENAWNSVMRFENGITGILKANYQTGGRVHTFELHGPEASAYLNLGFGGERCDAEILRNKGHGTHSLSAAGSGGFEIERFDGKSIARSDAYYRYYGYYEEDRVFAESIRTRVPSGADLNSFLKSMELADCLLAHRI